MKSLTIILKRRCTTLLNKIVRQKPSVISKILREETQKRSLAGIFEGLPDLSRIKKEFITTSNCAIYLVLRVTFKNDFNSANSESIWKCLSEFAKDDSVLFSVSDNHDYQVIEFDKNIQM